MISGILKPKTSSFEPIRAVTLWKVSNHVSDGFRIWWEFGTGKANNWHIQISSNIDFSGTLPVNDETITPTSTYYDATGLTDNTLYYIRIRAKYGVGSYSNWETSRAWTKPIMRTITAIAGNTPTVEGFTANWETLVAGDADSIDVQYASDVDFVNIIDTINVANTEISLAIHDLAQGTDYWYRIRSVVTVGIPTNGEWSNVIKKTTTAVAPPILGTPEDVTVEGAKLIWTKGTGSVDSWEVRLTVGEDISSIDSITDLFFAFDGYLQGVTITYEIRGKKTTNSNARYSEWSTPVELTTSLVGVLTSPNTTNNLDDEFTANWTLPDLSNLDAITLEVADNTDFTGATVHALAGTAESHTVTGLTALQTWYWRARGESLGQVSEWTAYATVEVLPIVSTAIDDSSSPQITKLDLHWLENVSGVLSDWHLQVALATDTAFANPVYDEEISGLLFAMLVTGLEPETAYIWRIRGVYYVDTIPYYGSWDGTGNTLTTEALPSVESYACECPAPLPNYLPITIGAQLTGTVSDYIEIQISDMDFDGEGWDSSHIVEESATLPIATILYETTSHLTPETRYWFRARGVYTAYGDLYASEWIGIREDTVAVDVPVFSSSDNSTSKIDMEYLTGAGYADVYNAEIYQDKGLTNRIASSTAIADTGKVTFSILVYHTGPVWVRCRGIAIHPNNPLIRDEGDWSEVT